MNIASRGEQGVQQIDDITQEKVNGIARECTQGYSESPERECFEDVLLLESLRTVVARINPAIPADVREEAIKQIQCLNSPKPIVNNERGHRATYLARFIYCAR